MDFDIRGGPRTGQCIGMTHGPDAPRRGWRDSLTPLSHRSAMHRRTLLLALALSAPLSLRAQAALTPDQAEARAIFEQLIDIKTSYKEGSTSPAAHAIAQRFLDAGFPAADVHVLGPAGDKDSNVVVRMALVAASASAMRRSISSASCGSKVCSVSPVVGLMVAMAMVLPFVVQGWVSKTSGCRARPRRVRLMWPSRICSAPSESPSRIATASM